MDSLTAGVKVHSDISQAIGVGDTSVDTVILQNHGPGTVYVRHDDFIDDNDYPAAFKISPGKNLRWDELSHELYFYGSDSDPDVTLPGGAGKAWLVVLAID